jgi:hypothetical protein
MLTVMLILAVAAFIMTLVAALGKVPIWVAVIILCLMELLRALPQGH